MFESFPKKRIELPESYKLIYNEHYKNNRQGKTTASSAAQKMEAWLHKKVAEDVRKNYNKKTLEIGAGTLNQLAYENTEDYDIVEPFKKLYEDSEYLDRVDKIYSDIDDIKLNQKYDRITSVATFEHILDLPKVVAKSCLLLNEGGTLRTSIPNEGNFVWGLGWKLTTGLEFRMKYGLNYGTLMRYEHVNNANEIEEVLHHFYGENKCSCFGLGKKASFYRFYESSKPKIDLAKKYLGTIE